MISGRTLLLALSLIAIPALDPGRAAAQSAQGDERAARLKSLEAERAAWRELRAATKKGDVLAAAALCSTMLGLEHPVPPPGTSGDARAAIEGLGRNLLQGLVKTRREQGQAARKAVLGRMCDHCSGSGVLVCKICSGREFKEVKSGRRIVRRPCPPYTICSSCSRSGRAAGTSSVEKDLIKLDTAIDRLIGRKKDPIGSIRTLHRQIKKLDTGGLLVPVGSGRRLRRLLPRGAPVDPAGLSQASKTELKAAWGRVTSMARRDFLRSLALESLAYVREVGFLEPKEALPRASKIKDEAESIPPRWLVLDPARAAGRIIRVDVVMDSPPKNRPAEGLPFVGEIPIKGLDPSIVRVFAYSKRDRGRLEAAGRSGLLPWAKKLVAALPRETPLSPDMEPGSQLTLYGRMVARDGLLPAFALEVWAIDTH